MSCDREDAVSGITAEVREAITGHYAAVVAAALGRAIGPAMLNYQMLAAVMDAIHDNAVAAMATTTH